MSHKIMLTNVTSFQFNGRGTDNGTGAATSVEGTQLDPGDGAREVGPQREG